jgi:hypothetical protein
MIKLEIELTFTGFSIVIVDLGLFVDDDALKMMEEA